MAQQRANAVGTVAAELGAALREHAIRGDLALDPAGFVVSQQLGPPINTTFTRRAK